MRAKPTNGASTRVSRAQWLQAALDALISDGVESVKVLTLATKLDASRSSFYWFFASRQDLLDQLLKHWRDTNTRAIVYSASLPAATIVDAILNVFSAWLHEAPFHPRLDSAIREWARRSGHVRRVIDQADDARVSALKNMYLRHGYKDRDAFVRARILYFMQVGYYALDLEEPLETRLSLTADYVRVYAGLEPEARTISRFNNSVIARRAGSRRRSVR